MAVEGIADQCLQPLWCETNFGYFRTVLLQTMYMYWQMTLNFLL